jgi:predicted glycoside hydrolase/deacetylase ChbG (UPF0249 family)
MNYSGKATTVIQLDSEQFAQLIAQIEGLKSTVHDLQSEVKHLHTHPHLGPWITSQQALKLMGLKDNRSLSKWCSRGVIECKSIAENGNKRLYKKADVLRFAERAEQYLRENE